MKFASRGTEDVYDGIASRAARKTLPSALHAKARMRLDQLVRAESLHALRLPPSNHLEALSGDRKGQYSIRINDKCRVCFEWSEQQARHIEIIDYH